MVPATNIIVAESQAIFRRFIREQGIKSFYDLGRGGICHQNLHEQGHVRPGGLVVGTDSHTTTHGAMCAVATGIGSTEMVGVFATGELWFWVPETMKIVLDGVPGVSGGSTFFLRALKTYEKKGERDGRYLH